MKKVINLKTQYSLKKTYTYNYFKLLNKSNLIFSQNNFNFLSYFFLLNFFFFNQNLYSKKTKFSNNLFFFYKKDRQDFLFVNKTQRNYYDNLIGKNYLIDEYKLNLNNNEDLLAFSKSNCYKSNSYKNDYNNFKF
jgi:hypothetical protein